MPLSKLLILLTSIFLGAVAQYVAMPQLEGLSPRYYLGISPEILKRQSGLCAANEHSCK